MCRKPGMNMEQATQQKKPMSVDLSEFSGDDRAEMAKMYEETLKKFVEVTQNAAYKPAVLDQIAVAYEKQTKWADALAAYEQILALRPDSDKALLGKGNALIGLKKYDEALPVLKHFMEVSKNDAKKKLVAETIKQLEGAKKR